VDRLEGPPEPKQRLEVILRTITGELSVEEACQTLGIAATHFHRLRDRALEGALSALMPGAPGRPRTEAPLDLTRIEELQAEVRDLKIDLRAAQIREEIAIVMPHLLKPARKKKERSGRRRRKK
jgi:transposase-like protein